MPVSADKKQAMKIVSDFQKSDKKRLSQIEKYKLVQTGYMLCTRCNQVKPVAEFHELPDSEIGYSSICLDHPMIAGSSKASTKKWKASDFAPESELKNEEEALMHFNTLIRDGIRGGDYKRVPKALQEAAKPYVDKGWIEYATTSRQFVFVLPKNTRKKKSE